MKELMKETEEKMKKSNARLAHEFTTIRAGRANPAVLDKVQVDYYGVPTPIQQMAAVSVSEARILVIQPWDVTSLKAIEKAILSSDVGITPTNDGKVLRLVFPQLTEDRRKELCKDIKKLGEETKVAVRNVRREAIEKLKAKKKASELTEDEVKDLIEQGTEDGTFEKSEQAMVDRIFHMSDQTAYSLMTPRTQMLWLDLTDSLRHNLRIIREHPQNVFPVGRENLDDFCGVLYAKDLLNASLERKSLDLAQYIRKPMFVPRSMETFRVLAKFRDTGIHEAMVLDEYGGVIGFITMNDILQEIMAILADKDVMGQLVKADTPQDVMNILKKEG